MPGTPTTRGYTTLSSADAADIEQVNVSLADIDSDVSAVETAANSAFTAYKTLVPWIGAAAGALKPWSGSTPVVLDSESVWVTTNIFSNDMHYLNPADYAASGRTTKYRLRTMLGVNSVAPAATFTFGMYPVTVAGYGGSGSENTYGFGAVVPGSTVVYTTPSASSTAFTASADFTPPAAGMFAFIVAVSTTPNANSVLDLRASLQYRQV